MHVKGLDFFLSAVESYYRIFKKSRNDVVIKSQENEGGLSPFCKWRNRGRPGITQNYQLVNCNARKDLLKLMTSSYKTCSFHYTFCHFWMNIHVYWWLGKWCVWWDNRDSLSLCQIKHIIQTFIGNLLCTTYQASSVLGSDIQECVRYSLCPQELLRTMRKTPKINHPAVLHLRNFFIKSLWTRWRKVG